MKALILWGIGMSGGIAVAAGLFTFLVITGIPHRLMTITHTTAYGGWYEWMFVLGGALGNAVWLTDTAVKIPAGMFLAGAAGLLVGIFIGCLIGAIAEVLDALPVFFKRIGIRQGIGVVIFWMAVGKTLADTYVSNSLHQFEILNIHTGVVSSDTPVRLQLWKIDDHKAFFRFMNLTTNKPVLNRGVFEWK